DGRVERVQGIRAVHGDDCKAVLDLHLDEAGHGLLPRGIAEMRMKVARGAPVSSYTRPSLPGGKVGRMHTSARFLVAAFTLMLVTPFAILPRRARATIDQPT